MEPTLDINLKLKKKIIGEKLSACMLQQSMCTVVGVASGLAIALRTKNMKHFLVCTVLGTLSDFLYGGMIACTDIIDQYRACENFSMKAKKNSDEKSN